MILFLSIYDWANQGRTMAKAVNAAGGKAIAASMCPLVFNGDRDENVIKSFKELESIISVSTHIVFMHSNPHFTKLPISTVGSKLYVFHGGSQYRNSPELCNSIFNPVIEKALVQTGDLLGLGAKNEVYINNGVDIEAIRATAGDIKPRGDMPVVGFFPSNANVKGWHIISPVLSRLKKEFEGTVHFAVSTEQKPWEANIRMMANCDIIIDAVMPALGTKMYGEWGVQALEAAALGKVVLSHFYNQKAYADAIGGHSILVCNTGLQLYDNLQVILKKATYKQIQKRGRTTMGWCERSHSLKTFGTRILEAMEV